MCDVWWHAIRRQRAPILRAGRQTLGWSARGRDAGAAACGRGGAARGGSAGAAPSRGLGVADSVAQRADSAHGHFDDVAGDDLADARRGPGENHVTREKREYA